METPQLYFIKRKYGKELLIDCSLHSESTDPLPKGPVTVDFYGIFVITEGKGDLLIDNTEFHFQKGTLLFIQPHQVRQWQHVSSDFDCYFLVFEEEFTQTFFQDGFFIFRFQFFHSTVSENLLECEPKFLNTIVDSCKAIHQELTQLQEDSHHLLRSILYNLLIRINREYISHYGCSAQLFQNNLGLQLKKLLEIRIRNYQRVDDYAKNLKVSRGHLNNVSKKVFRMPVSVLIKKRLLTEIKRELLYTNKSIKEICYDLNFSDVANFMRFFKAQAGINPNEYRSKYAK